MSRKISAYARRMRLRPQGETYNAAEWLNAISRSRHYDEEPIPGGIVKVGTISAATTMAVVAYDALKDMSTHAVAPDDTAKHDDLAHVIDVGSIRAAQKGGDQEARAGVLADFQEARSALLSVRARWEKTQQWGTTVPEREAIAQAVKHYESLLLTSSPAQMSEADRLRRVALAKHAKGTACTTAKA